MFYKSYWPIPYETDLWNELYAVCGNVSLASKAYNRLKYVYGICELNDLKTLNVDKTIELKGVGKKTFQLIKTVYDKHFGEYYQMTIYDILTPAS